MHFPGLALVIQVIRNGERSDTRSDDKQVTKELTEEDLTVLQRQLSLGWVAVR